MLQKHSEAPIFILGAGKSGTSLLRSLLDGHPSLFVVPREAHFFEYVTRDWVDYRMRRCWPEHIPDHAVSDSLNRAVRTQLSDLNPAGDGVFAGYDLNAFNDYVDRAPTPEGYPGLFCLYMNALHYSIHKKPIPERMTVVEKSVESAEYASVLQWMFPDCRFLHIVRNPYANIVSLRRFKTINGRYPCLAPIVSSLYNSYYYLYKNRIHLRNYHVLRFEDLLNEPLEVMQRVAGWLVLDWADCLLEPTVLGRPWGDNSTQGDLGGGISKAPLHHWRDDVHALEIALCNHIGSPVLEEFGYDRLASGKRKWWPIRGERLKTYVWNRAIFGNL
ncbi:MAG: sulfotransferase [Candidatus Pacebacteria bacterium]|nr:sulfotransferase [Candidatus Paceibacterota bacterium]